MDKIFLDTNVLLDVVGERMPFVTDAKAVLSLIDKNEIEGWISVISINNIYYIIRKLSSDKIARNAIEKIMSIVKCVPVNEDLLRQALALSFKDYEDAIQYACALSMDCEVILTRDIREFTGLNIPALTPADFIALRNAVKE